jgi:hypothetical protein
MDVWAGLKRVGMQLRRANKTTVKSVARRVTDIDHWCLNCPTKTITFKAELLENHVKAYGQSYKKKQA